MVGEGWEGEGGGNGEVGSGEGRLGEDRFGRSECWSERCEFRLGCFDDLFGFAMLT